MDDVFYFSREGLAHCPGCGRHVLLQEDVASTRCPFCDQLILDGRWDRTSSATDAIARLGGVSGRIAETMKRLSGMPPAKAQRPRDASLDGDLRKLVRSVDPDHPSGQRPLYAVWELTLKCDLACRHCGSRAGQARANELSTDECFDLVDQLSDAGVREVTLIGGEAYLRKDWSAIVQRIVQHGIACTMTTGARNLTAQRVRAAADSGIASIAISIDGLEATHDAQRGVRGSWQSAVRAAQRVSASGIRLTTNTQINALSAPEMPAVARLLDQIGSAAWQVQLTVAMGRAADRPGLLLQPYQLLEVFTLLVWCNEYILEPNGIVLLPSNNIGYFSPFEQHLRYGGGLGTHWSACTAGGLTLGIEADGSIKGCPSLPSEAYVGGNIRDAPLREIIERRPQLTSLGRRTVADLWGYCHACYYAQICLGGCTWTSHTLLGRPGNNPYCIHRALEFEARGVGEEVVKVQPAPGKPFDAGRFEIVEKPLGSDTNAETIAGIPLERILSAGPDTRSLWDPAVLNGRLAPLLVGLAVGPPRS